MPARRALAAVHHDVLQVVPSVARRRRSPARLRVVVRFLLVFSGRTFFFGSAGLHVPPQVDLGGELEHLRQLPSPPRLEVEHESLQGEAREPRQRADRDPPRRVGFLGAPLARVPVLPVQTLRRQKRIQSGPKAQPFTTLRAFTDFFHRTDRPVADASPAFPAFSAHASPSARGTLLLEAVGIARHVEFDLAEIDGASARLARRAAPIARRDVRLRPAEVRGDEPRGRILILRARILLVARVGRGGLARSRGGFARGGFFFFFSGRRRRREVPPLEVRQEELEELGAVLLRPGLEGQGVREPSRVGDRAVAGEKRREQTTQRRDGALSGRGSRRRSLCRRSLCRRFRAPDASDAVRVIVRRDPGPSRLVAREPPPSFTPLRSRGVFIFFPRVGFVFFVSFGFHREHARSEGGQREEALQRGVDVARRAEILQPRGLRSRPPRERPGVVPHRASNERVQVLLPQPGPAPRADGRDEAADAVASTSAALTIRRARMTIVAHRGQRRGASGVGEEEPQRARVVQVAPERAPTQLRHLRRVVRGARRGRARGAARHGVTRVSGRRRTPTRRRPRASNPDGRPPERKAPAAERTEPPNRTAEAKPRARPAGPTRTRAPPRDRTAARANGVCARGGRGPAPRRRRYPHRTARGKLHSDARAAAFITAVCAHR